MNTEELYLEFRPTGKNGHAKVILRQDGKPLFCDKVNLSSAKARDCFLEKVCERFPGLALGARHWKTGCCNGPRNRTRPTPRAWQNPKGNLWNSNGPNRGPKTWPCPKCWPS